MKPIRGKAGTSRIWVLQCADLKMALCYIPVPARRILTYDSGQYCRDECIPKLSRSRVGGESKKVTDSPIFSLLKSEPRWLWIRIPSTMHNRVSNLYSILLWLTLFRGVPLFPSLAYNIHFGCSCSGHSLYGSGRRPLCLSPWENMDNTPPTSAKTWSSHDSFIPYFPPIQKQYSIQPPIFYTVKLPKTSENFQYLHEIPIGTGGSCWRVGTKRNETKGSVMRKNIFCGEKFGNRIINGRV